MSFFNKRIMSFGIILILYNSLQRKMNNLNSDIVFYAFKVRFYIIHSQLKFSLESPRYYHGQL